MILVQKMLVALLLSVGVVDARSVVNVEVRQGERILFEHPTHTACRGGQSYDPNVMQVFSWVCPGSSGDECQR